MRSLPTSPRRRGSLQPDCNWLTVDAQRRWAAGPLPGRKRRVFRGITYGSRSVAFPRLRTPHRPDLDVPHDANAADLVGEFHIVAPGLDARDSQALSTVPSRSFLHWSGPQLSAPAGDIRKVVIVYRARFQNRMPLRSCARTDEPTSPNTIKANSQRRSFASR